MAQLIQRVATWVAQEIAVPLLAKSKPFQAAARASVNGVEKVKEATQMAKDATEQAKAEAKDVLNKEYTKIRAPVDDEERNVESVNFFQSIKEAVKAVSLVRLQTKNNRMIQQRKIYLKEQNIKGCGKGKSMY